ncbi:Spy0128 family protein, partial [Carnobacterium sp.]|uniref:Spy0128 family protein n=1 Tax=Carnobacterium sp. TaxID=48221 RepID=UPI0028A651F6
ELSVSKKALSIDKAAKPNRIHWEIYANDNKTSQHVNLVNALLEDKIPADQRLIADSIVVTRADGVPLEKLVGITANDNDFKIEFPDGPYQYTISYQTEIVKYPSEDPTNINQYNNYTKLTNQPGTKLEQTDDARAFINYFYDGTNNRSSKTGTQNPETENGDWTAVVNPLGLTINNAKIVDTLIDNSTYVKDTLKLTNAKGIEISSNLYTLTFAENNRSFTIEFNKNLTTPIHLSYSTRLDDHLIGSYKVTNTIELLGGQEKRSIDKQVSETSSQQWFYGGGGSGRTVQFELTKQNSDGVSLEGAEFMLESVNINNVSSLIDAEIVTNEKGVYISGDIRAGRYILTETKAPDGFKKLEKPIYFMIGYAKTGDGYTATLTNSNWKSAENGHASAAGNELTIINEYEPVSVILEALKLLEGNKSLEEGQFTFELLKDGKVIDTQSNDSKGKITFKELSYTEIGTYQYQIREVEGKLHGVTYDLEPRNVTVTVANDKDGKLIPAVSYDEKNNIPKFTNTYKADPTSVTFKAKKILQGQELATDQFAFELVDAEKNVVQTVKNNAQGDINFKAISYETAGEYTYTIREVVGDQGGVDYDPAEFTVKVTIIDDGNGQLVATEDYGDKPVVFTNTYTAESGSVALKASKVLTGQELMDGQFEFELVDSTDKVIQTSKNNATGQINFDPITYDKIGEHTYTIREVKGSQGGVAYDPTEFKVKVTITDDGNGQLVATEDYGDKPVVFANTYTAESGSVELEASKTLTGLELVNGQFEFELVDSAGKVVQTKTNNAVGQVTFDKISYEEVGEYAYTIREVKGAQNGITYDDSEKAVVVDVVDNGQGKLVATAKYENGSAAFINKYVPAPVRIELKAKKVLEDQELAADQFAFDLVNADGEVLQTVGNNATGQIIFDEITYDKVGKHTYTIREVKGTQGGVTYDSTEYEVVVTVTDDKEGNLHAKTVYSNGEVIFNNSYKANDGLATIKASKKLEGQNLRENHFEFNLLDENEKVIQTATNNAKGQINFNALTFTEPGKYVFYIEEVNNKLGGVTYDETRYTATVIVTDNAKGQLETTIEYNEEPIFTNQYVAAPAIVDFRAKKILEGQTLVTDQFAFELVDMEGKVLQTVNNNTQGDINFEAIKYETAGEYAYTIREVQGDLGGVKYDKNEFKVDVTVVDNGKGQLIASSSYFDGPASFTNTYIPDPDSVVLEASKVLNGQELREGQFEFELVDNVGKVIQTSKNNVEGQVFFDKITYDKVGEHTYKIREVQGSQGGVTYDDSDFKVDITVKDDGKGNLVATTNYIDGPAVFNNTYTSDPDSVVLEASKTLTGLELVNDQFKFELVDSAGKVIQTKTNNAVGQVTFDEIPYEEVGEYTYTIREVQGSQGGVTYDANEFPVNVIVEDNGEGNLVATSRYTKGPANFTNEYVPASDSVVIEADKILEGQNLVADQFAFELVNADGRILQTVGNNATGQVIFDEITYDEVGEHTYTVREVKGSQGGVTYDANEFRVDVTVTDNGKGQLIASSNYVDGPVSFTNMYTPDPDSVVLEASKTLTGLEL